MTFKESTSCFTPNGFSSLQRLLKEESKGLGLRSALALVRLSQHDPDVFYKLKQARGGGVACFGLCRFGNHERRNRWFVNTNPCRACCSMLRSSSAGCVHTDFCRVSFSIPSGLVRAGGLTLNNLGVIVTYSGIVGYYQAIILLAVPLSPDLVCKA